MKLKMTPLLFCLALASTAHATEIVAYATDTNVQLAAGSIWVALAPFKESLEIVPIAKTFEQLDLPVSGQAGWRWITCRSVGDGRIFFGWFTGTGYTLILIEFEIHFAEQLGFKHIDAAVKANKFA